MQQAAPCIYLDYNATTPIDKEVADAMRPFLEFYFGNPSSSHPFGVTTKLAVENARKQVAAALNCHPDEILFTSGGSESNNHAIKGYALQHRDKGKHIVTSAFEHPAVTEVCKYLEREHGFNVTYVPVDREGMIDLKAFEDAITPQTILVSIMHANNEVGTVQPIAELVKIARKKGTNPHLVIHSDCAQSIGKVPVTVPDLGVDLLSVCGHKLYAPKGIGALYIRRGITLQKIMHGADHESGRRAGTENILEIAGLGKAMEIAAHDLEKNMKHMKEVRDRLHEGLDASLKQMGMTVKLNGHFEHRLPNTLSLSFPHMEANTLLSEIQDRVAASAGAACHSDRVDVSAVLTAMKVPLEYAMGTIRFSTGRYSTAEQIDEAIQIVTNAVRKLRPQQERNLSFEGEEEDEVCELINPDDVKLTRFTHGLGCACKLSPVRLQEILQKLPRPLHDSNILVGTETSDDAAVYKINDDTALVNTLDFFTPIVDDAYQYGAISAANALSDVYAMGGKPLFALNIVAFPSKRLPMETLLRILQGASDVAKEAGVSILGGHSIDDNEPKFGMAVTGVVHPERIWKNTGAKKGDDILLTKPLGTGIITTAIKRGLAEKAVADKAVETMRTLNKIAAEAALSVGHTSVCTDVTGFGLLGHLMEMSVSSKVNPVIWMNEVPVLPGALELAGAGIIPGGTKNNRNFVSGKVEWTEGTQDTPGADILCDAQTSGGLLLLVPSEHRETLIGKLKEMGTPCVAWIGSFIEEGEGTITVKLNK